MVQFVPASSQTLAPRSPLDVLTEQSDKLMLRIHHMYMVIEQGQQDMKNLSEKIEEYQRDLSRYVPGSGQYVQLMELVQQAEDDITRLRAQGIKILKTIQRGSEHFDQYMESIGLDIGKGCGPDYGYAQRIAMDDFDEDPELDAKEGWTEAPLVPRDSVPAETLVLETR
ncbi:hypothetical protein M406DRAFT_335202 [Cryphonectria parasitica EP155]|uniref:Uncharacterized protein n=1 Tax=Cryphonectria parasitica (strain ATCC 38755 / EP155) TaxID=660469 RepID=A0A9P4XSP3_CRYP1|nr:uncharacterized protein M406DRAFT_335202 [Cryphonectria parasitica EP155]KAF3759990.1 hypothetical protein M406DRAFT_335202 [Cryphonectria parasitica EP155]